MKGRILLLLSGGEQKMINHKKLFHFYFFKEILQWQKSLQNVRAWRSRKVQKWSGKLQKHKKFIIHLFESISEGGEAAVFEQKRQSCGASVCDLEVFPRHVQ